MSSLAHVPRRAVARAKELRRMGLDVVRRAPQEREEVMSSDVKAVTDVANDVARLGERARDVADAMRQSIEDTHQALNIAESVSKSLALATAELRGALGVQTNNPPEEEEVQK